MLTTKCENCTHCHVCGIKEERLTMMNMVADNLGPHFDLFCKEYSAKTTKTTPSVGLFPLGHQANERRLLW